MIINKKIYILVIAAVIGLSSSQSVFAKSVKHPKKQKQKQEQQTTLKGKAVIVDINSDKLEYFQDKNEYVATGSAEVIIKEQDSKLKADKITYDEQTQQVVAEGNVKIIKAGQVMNGDFARVDLDKESALIDNPNTTVDVVNIKAKTANLYPENMDAFKGTATLTDSNLNLMLSSNVFSTAKRPENSKPSTSKSTDKPKYNISAKELIINQTPDRNIMILKSAVIKIDKHKIATIPYLEMSTDKDLQQIETSLPEIGSNQQMGMYAGPGHVFYLPGSATFKVAPILSIGEGFGGGGLMRFMNSTNRTQFAYTSNKNKGVLRGEQELFSENTRLLYGINDYVDDGLFGDALPNYIAQIVDDREFPLKDINYNLRLRSSVGYAEDYDRHWGTGRIKFQGDFLNIKPFWHYKDYVGLGIESQFDVSVYGTGQTFGMVRIGPRIDSTVGPLTFSAAYFQGGIHGTSPFLFDRYMQGKSNTMVLTIYKINRYLDVGYYGFFNLTKDNWEGKFLTENQLYTRIGPEDFKFRLGYDTVRKRTLFGIDLLVGAGRTAIDFDKMHATKKEAPRGEKQKKKKLRKSPASITTIKPA